MTSQEVLREPLSKQWKTAWMLILVASAAFFSAPLLAQQTGEITGQVTNASDGSAVSGVVITATSPVLPGNRTATTAANGTYKLALLPPGFYTITYTLSDDSTRTRATDVMLQQRALVDLAVDMSADSAAMEEVIVVGTSTLAADTGGATITAAISSDVFDALPVGQEYRDLIKLIPGVQYSQDSTRGPSAGGNGQDNVYQFDGVDVSLPMFGTLSAEPSTHDIDQVSIIRGGATAVGFNRSGGFTINTISKRGTNEFHAEASYQIQDASMTSDRDYTDEKYTTDQDWIAANVSGPIFQDKLYFYASYYSPTITRDNRSNAYGEVPNFRSDRDEYFGKLTWAPTENLLFDASYRTSDRSSENSGVGAFTTASASTGSAAEQNIGIIEGSWIINGNSNMYFKVTDFEDLGSSAPDTVLDLAISIGDSLDISNLNQMGLFRVPKLSGDNPGYDAWAQPLIDRYGYIEGGEAQGGGLVGAGTTFNDGGFTREAFEVGYDLTLEFGNTTHDLHIGYHQEELTEDLSRTSNGWGFISPTGGLETTDDGTPIYYEARFQQMSLLDGSGNLVPPIHSESTARNVELNDSISWNNFTFNVGVLISEDKLYGQGLKKNKDNLSGFETALGHKYLMKETSFSEMVQPRLGVTWDINDSWTAFASYALYHPSASSLARAASWGRNLRREINARFDIDGNFIEVDPVRSSSGKLFQKGIDPRSITEYTIGAAWEVNDRLTTRAHIRYREGKDFWEDTWNWSRSTYACSNEPDRFGCMPAGWAPEEAYIPELNDYRDEIGGSSYVIAALDRAYTDYYELNLEAEWNGDRYYVSASYVYSDYTGNFDQDNTTTANDANTFIGSSNLADGRGRQLWNFKDGTLRGNRPHVLKAMGFYELNWNATVGAYAVYQSGQPWEVWDGSIYGYSNSTNRYAEKAGTRETDAHYQLDLNYTQNFYFGSANRFNVQLRADVFNVFDNQTGYNIQSKKPEAGFGNPRSYYSPRRLQLMAKILF